MNAGQYQAMNRLASK